MTINRQYILDLYDAPRQSPVQTELTVNHSTYILTLTNQSICSWKKYNQWFPRSPSLVMVTWFPVGNLVINILQWFRSYVDMEGRKTTLRADNATRHFYSGSLLPALFEQFQSIKITWGNFGFITVLLESRFM